MTDYAEISLSDGTPVRLALAPVGTPNPLVPAPPGQLGGVSPVGRVANAVSTAAEEGLRAVLRPLGPLLQEVHDAVAGAADPPHEVTVEFGVQIGQDLKLGIVGATGQASLTVSATWHLPQPPPAPAGD